MRNDRRPRHPNSATESRRQRDAVSLHTAHLQKDGETIYFGQKWPPRVDAGNIVSFECESKERYQTDYIGGADQGSNNHSACKAVRRFAGLLK